MEKIELSFDILLETSVYVDVEKSRWEAMTTEEKRELISEKIRMISESLGNDRLQVPNSDVMISSTVSADAVPDPDEVRIHDPNEETDVALPNGMSARP